MQKKWLERPDKSEHISKNPGAWRLWSPALESNGSGLKSCSVAYYLSDPGQVTWLLSKPQFFVCKIDIVVYASSHAVRMMWDNACTALQDGESFNIGRLLEEKFNISSKNLIWNLKNIKWKKPDTKATCSHLYKMCAAAAAAVASVVSDSVWPHRRQPTRLPRPWDSPGKNTGVGCHFLLQCMKVKSQSEVTQSCPTLSDPMDCSLPGSSIHGIF